MDKELLKSNPESDLITKLAIAQIRSDTGLIFIMDDLSNKRCLFVQKPPNSHYWWLNVNGFWYQAL